MKVGAGCRQHCKTVSGRLPLSCTTCCAGVTEARRRGDLTCSSCLRSPGSSCAATSSTSAIAYADAMRCLLLPRAVSDAQHRSPET